MANNKYSSDAILAEYGLSKGGNANGSPGSTGAPSKSQQILAEYGLSKGGNTVEAEQEEAMRQARQQAMRMATTNAILGRNDQLAPTVYGKSYDQLSNAEKENLKYMGRTVQAANGNMSALPGINDYRLELQRQAQQQAEQQRIEEIHNNALYTDSGPFSYTAVPNTTALDNDIAEYDAMGKRIAEIEKAMETEPDIQKYSMLYDELKTLQPRYEELGKTVNPEKKNNNDKAAEARKVYDLVMASDYKALAPVLYGKEYSQLADMEKEDLVAYVTAQTTKFSNQPLPVNVMTHKEILQEMANLEMKIEGSDYDQSSPEAYEADKAQTAARYTELAQQNIALGGGAVTRTFLDATVGYEADLMNNAATVIKWFSGNSSNEGIGRYGTHGGNIDLYNRPQYINEDGSKSTVQSISIALEPEGPHYLIPTIVYGPDGQPQKLNRQEAEQHFLETGEFLGVFDTPEEATAYAEQLHEQQDAYYSDNVGSVLQRASDQLSDFASNDINAMKAEYGNLGDAAVDIGMNIIQMAYDGGFGEAIKGAKLLGSAAKVKGAAGKVATFVTDHAALVPMFFRSTGGGMREARVEGATDWQQVLYGSAAGLVEVATELIGDGVAGIYGKAFNKNFEKTVEDFVTKTSQSALGRLFLRGLKDAADEGIEEVVSDVLNPFISLIYDKQALDNFKNREFWSEMLYDFFIGAAVSGLTNTTATVSKVARHRGTTIAFSNLTQTLNTQDAIMVTDAAQHLENEPFFDKYDDRKALDEYGNTERSNAINQAAYSVWLMESLGVDLESATQKYIEGQEKAEGKKAEQPSDVHDKGEKLEQYEGKADTTQPETAPEEDLKPVTLETLEETPVNEQEAPNNIEETPVNEQVATGNEQEAKPETKATQSSEVHDKGEKLNQYEEKAEEPVKLEQMPEESKAEQETESVPQMATLDDLKQYVKDNVDEPIGMVGNFSYTVDSNGTVTVVDEEKGTTVWSEREGEGRDKVDIITDAIHAVAFGNKFGQLDEGDSYDEGTNISDGRQGRKPLQSKGKSDGTVQKVSGTSGRSETQSSRADRRKNDAESGKYQVKKCSELVAGGASENVYVIPEDQYDDELKEASKKCNEETGITPTYVVGPIHVKGEIVTGAFTYDKDGKPAIIVRADHANMTAKQLTGHETFHALKESNSDLMPACKEAYTNNVPYETRKKTAVRYLISWNPMDAEESFIEGIAKGTVTDEEIDALLDKYEDDMYEEIFADANGEIVRFGRTAPTKGLSDLIKPIVDERLGKNAQSQGVQETNGPNETESKKSETEYENDEHPTKDITEIQVNDEGESIATFDANTESVAARFSRDTWESSDYVTARDQAAEEIADKLDISVEKARAYIDDINTISAMIAEDLNRLDYKSSPGRSSFVSNVEYGGSFDFSTLCKKRRLITGTLSAIQKALPNTVLSAQEILDIRNMMKDAGLEVNCGLCYVEGSRANMGVFTNEFLKLYKKYNPGAWVPNMAEMNTPDGIEQVRIQHPEVYEQYEKFWNNHGRLTDADPSLFASQQKPKLYQLRTEYKGEILTNFKDSDKIAEKNKNGGIRCQSFSDFEIVHLIDMMQIVMDMSRVGLAGQAYTKVPDFAWALGDTGMKINLSLIAKDVDEDGNLVFDDVEGMPYETAMELRDEYPENVGTILVCFTDAQLKAAMADDTIDFIIPFHRSQWKKSQYADMGLPANTKDFTYMQNEKFMHPNEHTHEFRGRIVKDKAANFMPNEYWDFSKSGKENAETYLRMCFEADKRPKFYKLLDKNGDGSYSLKADGSTDGYWKLLIDFKMYDNDGVGSPQLPVKPQFNMDKAQEMLNNYQGGHESFPVAQDIVKKFVDQKKAEERPIKLGKKPSYSSDEFESDTSEELQNAREIKKAISGTFFSGGGMVDLALASIIDSEFAVEYDPKISAVYQQNNETRFMGADVMDFDSKEFEGKIDYFHASPVCKTYSNAISNQGKQNRLDNGIDMATAKKTAEAIRNIKPRAFTLENVKGYQDSEPLQQIKDALTEEGYTWDEGVYNAADYGAATSRERYFIRAVKDGNLPALPSKLEPSEYKSWHSVVEDLIDTLPEADTNPRMINSLRDISGIDVNNIAQPLLVFGESYKNGEFGHAWADEPMPTIIANSGASRIFMPDGRVLEATPRVLARISGLPDSYQLPKSKTLARTIIGNGVPIDLTKAIAGPVIQEAVPSTRGIKYSEDDYEELAKDPEANEAQLQQMVNQAADAAGYTIEAYHGTPTKGFTQFRTYDTRYGLFGNGAYFTSDENVARSYSELTDRAYTNDDIAPGIYHARLKLDSMLDMNAEADIERWGEAIETATGWDALMAETFATEIRGEEYESLNLDPDLNYSEWKKLTFAPLQNEYFFRALERILQEDGYAKWEAQEIIRETLEGMGYDSITHIGGGRYDKTDDNRHQVYIAFNPEQIKSADPVTYDDDGNVIPLSERFNTSNPDIRYSEDDYENSVEDSNLEEYTEPNDRLKRAIQMFDHGVKLSDIFSETRYMVNDNGEVREASNPLKVVWKIDDVNRKANQKMGRNLGRSRTQTPEERISELDDRSDDRAIQNRLRSTAWDSLGRTTRAKLTDVFENFVNESEVLQDYLSVYDTIEDATELFYSKYQNSNAAAEDWLNYIAPDLTKVTDAFDEILRETHPRHSSDDFESEPWSGTKGLNLGGLTVDEYMKQAQARAIAAREQRTRTILREDFKGSDALDKLGIKISGSVGLYDGLKTIIKADKTAKAIRNLVDKAEARLRPTTAEKQFAHGIANGLYSVEDIPNSMSKATVSELADFYTQEKNTESDILSRQKTYISSALQEKCTDLFSKTPTVKKPDILKMHFNTPERNMRSIFGNEAGKKIYDEIFAPVYENSAEAIRFTNRQFDEVREIEGKDGKKKKLNKQERALTMKVIEGRAAAEMVAGNAMSEAIQSAVQNAMNGSDLADEAKAFNLGKSERQLAQDYKAWLETKKALESSKVDAVRVNNAADLYTKKFNDFYDAINDFLVAHGYETIGFIKGYAPHKQVQGDRNLLQDFFSNFGIGEDISSLPTEIAGLTASYKPNKRWNPYFLERNGKEANYDIVDAYESYIRYLSDIFYHTDDVMRIREMSKWFRMTYSKSNNSALLEQAMRMRTAPVDNKRTFLETNQMIENGSTMSDAEINQKMTDYVDKLFADLGESSTHGDLVMWLDNYANLLAGKQSVSDRSSEATVGRKRVSFGNKLARRFAMSQVAAKVSSVLNQTAQLPLIYAELGPVYTAWAIKDVIGGRLTKASWIQDSDFLTGKGGIDFIQSDFNTKLMEVMFAGAEFVDTNLSAIAVRGAYLKAINEGLNHTEAMRKADNYAANIMGNRLKGTKPTIFDSKNVILKMVTMFQLEALNTWEHTFKDLPFEIQQTAKKKGKATAALQLASTIVNALLSSFVMNRLWDELYGGTPAPYDVLGLTANFMATGESMTTNQYVMQLVDNVTEQLTDNRFFGTVPDDRLNDGEFNFGAARKELKEQISNELPIVRNISTLLGWGDDTLPLAGLNSLKNIKEELDKFDEGKGNPTKLLEAFGKFGLEFAPAGSQVKRSYEGVKAFIQGGRYNSKGNLQYAVDQDPLTLARMAVFGQYAVPQAQEYFANGYSALTDPQMRMYNIITNNSEISNTDIVNMLRDIDDLKADYKNDKVASGGADSITQEDAKKILDKVEGSNYLKAVLWQCMDARWTGDKNPYNTEVGRKIYSALHDKDGKTISDPDFEGLSLPKLG